MSSVFKSSSSKHLSKRQIKSFQASEERRKKRKLQNQVEAQQQANTSGTKATTTQFKIENEDESRLLVTDEMVQDAVLKSRIDRLQSLLPGRSYVKPTTLKDAVQKKMQQIPDRISRIPYKSLKRHVSWLSPTEQGSKSALSLTEELERFAAYVALDEAEVSARKALIQDIQAVLRCKVTDADVNAFGSYAADLSIFLSDIDLSIVFQDGLPAPFPSSSVNTSTSITETATNNTVLTNSTLFNEEVHRSTNKLTNEAAIVNHNSRLVKFTEDEVLQPVDPLKLSTEEVEEKKKERVYVEIHDSEEDDEVEVTWTLDTGKAPAASDLKEASPQRMVGKKRKLMIDDVYDDDRSEPSSSEPEMDSEDTSSSSVEDDGDMMNFEDEEEDIDVSRGFGDEDEDIIMDSDEHEVINIDSSEENVEIDEIFDGKEDAESDDEDVEQGEEVEVYSVGSHDGEIDDEEEEENYEEDDLMLPNKRARSDYRQPSIKLEEDLDIQLIDEIVPHHQTSASEGLVRRVRSLNNDEMDFTNAFPLIAGQPAADNNSGVTGEKKTVADLDQRNQQVAFLRNLFSVLKQMEWIKAMEFRHRARVPIINLLHRSGVECDVSLGLAAKDTSDVIRYIKAQSGYALFALSAFLKVFLYQTGLDQPFFGGLGSFKLYVMISKHIERHPQYVKDKELPNLGLLLLSFFKYYSSPMNLNEFTAIDIGYSDGSKVTFEQTKLLPYITQVFAKAFRALDAECRARWTSLKQRSSSSEDEAGEKGKSDYHDNIRDMDSDFSDEEEGKQQTSSNNRFSHLNNITKSQLSSSLLALLLDCGKLTSEREGARRQCHEYPSSTTDDGDQMAKSVLNVLQDYLSPMHGSVSLEEIESRNPLLALRLRSFPSEEVVRYHLRNKVNIPGEGSYNRTYITNSSSSNSNNASSKPSYSVSHYGIIGNSIKATMPKITSMTSEKKQKRYTPNHKKEYHQQKTMMADIADFERGYHDPYNRYAALDEGFHDSPHRSMSYNTPAKKSVPNAGSSSSSANNDSEKKPKGSGAHIIFNNNLSNKIGAKKKKKALVSTNTKPAKPTPKPNDTKVTKKNSFSYTPSSTSSSVEGNNKQKKLMNKLRNNPDAMQSMQGFTNAHQQQGKGKKSKGKKKGPQ